LRDWWWGLGAGDSGLKLPPFAFRNESEAGGGLFFQGLEFFESRPTPRRSSLPSLPAQWRGTYGRIQFIQLHVNNAGIAVLGVLDQEDQQERDYRRGRIDD